MVRDRSTATRSPTRTPTTSGRACSSPIGRRAGVSAAARSCIGGGGRIRSSLGDGTRIFAEGGGGLSSGPFGVELSVKFAWNRLDEPVVHRFLTIPITLRGTLSF